jgi:hypothetical protein
MWKNLKQGYFFYSALLFRDHILNPLIWKRFFRNDYTAMLLFGLILSLATQQFVTITIVLSLSLYTLRALKHTWDAKAGKNKIGYCLERLFYQVISDLCFWFGFIFYFPQSSEISSRKVK